MKIGKLYLIPTILGEGTEGKTLPSSVLNAIKDIDIFIVENIRTSRRFIKKMYKEKDIDNTIFYSYGKHDKLDLQEDFLPHIYEGKDVGIISEAVPIVGPSSILLALMASGLNGQNFAFNGYLPIDKKERNHKLKDLEMISKKSGQTQVFMETPYRNLQLFEAILSVCSKTTKLCIASNISLTDEQITSKTLEEWKTEKPNIHKKPTIFLISSRDY